MKAKKLHQRSPDIDRKESKKGSKAEFTKKALLLEPSKSPKRPDFKKKAAKNKVSAKVSGSTTSGNKVDKTLNVAKIPVQMQEQIADNLYNSYTENSSEATKRMVAMWGAGLAIPLAFETLGIVAGIQFPDLRLLFISNLAFAAAFRFTVGKEIIQPHDDSVKAKSARATELLSSGKISSEKAQNTLAKMISANAAYEILSKGKVTSTGAEETLVKRIKGHDKALALLEGGMVKSEAAQSALLDRIMPKLTSAQAGKLLKSSGLTAKVKERVFQKATHKPGKAG